MNSSLSGVLLSIICFTAVTTRALSCLGKSARLANLECAAWQQFFEETGGPKWGYCRDMKADPCGCEDSNTGKAVVCDGEGQHIIEIRLDSNELHGKIHTLYFPHLQRLNLAYNDLTGALPTLEQLSKLHQLDLHVNKFTGPLPTSINKLTMLKYLKLDNNELAGAIPAVDNLAQLVGLELYSNQFNGTIPTSLLQLPKVICCRRRALIFQPIYSILPTIVQLHKLELSNNLLAGTIPDFTQLTQLKLLYLGMKFTEPSLWQVLKYACPGKNRLTGEVPSTLAKMKKLTGTIHQIFYQLCIEANSNPASLK